MCGWAKNNSVTEGKYIDPTMTPSPAARRFFGMLIPSAPQHLLWLCKPLALGYWQNVP
jgi:hypothetical protein